jgi:hypothetical protein
MKKTALWVSLVLTAFLLILAGGIVTTVKGAQKALDAAAQVSDQAIQQPTDTPTQSIDPALQQAINDREAAYQKMIAEANARLAQAQKDEQALQAQLQALQQNTSPAAAPTDVAQPVSISPQQAAQVAGSYIHRSDAYSVETVSANGGTAYKVTFSSGDVVYVNLAGQVLSVQYAPRASSPAAPRSFSNEHEHEGEPGGD